MNKLALCGAILFATTLCSCAQGDGKDKCDRPLARTQKPEESPGLMPIANLVRLSAAGDLSWNGAHISDETLAQYLRQSARMSPHPEIILAIEPGSNCARTLQVRETLKAAQICSIGRFCTEANDWEDPGGRKISASTAAD